MDPIITTAIIGAIANLSKDAIKDGYTALKTGLKKRFGDDSDLVDAVEKLEKKPDSEARKAALQEELETAKVHEDPELLQLAQALIETIKEQPGGETLIQQTQTNTISGSTVNVSGGSFEFQPNQQGQQIGSVTVRKDG